MRLGRAYLLKLNGKEETQKRRFIWRNPLMHTNKVLRLRADAGFFPQLTGGGFH